MDIIGISISEREYKRAVETTDFLCNLHKYKIINETELILLINYFADKHAREKRELSIVSD